MVDFKVDIINHYKRKYLNEYKYVYHKDYNYLHDNVEKYTYEGLYHIAYILYNTKKVNLLKDYYGKCAAVAAYNYGLDNKREVFKIRDEMCAEIGKYIIDNSFDIRYGIERSVIEDEDIKEDFENIKYYNSYISVYEYKDPSHIAADVRFTFLDCESGSKCDLISAADSISGDLNYSVRFALDNCEGNCTKIVYFERLYVYPNYRRNHIASSILDKLETIIEDSFPSLKDENYIIVGIVQPDNDRYCTSDMKSIMSKIVSKYFTIYSDDEVYLTKYIRNN